MCRLSAIAGSPELYPELVRLGGIPPILTLLSHDNGDIAAAAVELLREMTDADVVEDSVRVFSPDMLAQCWRFVEHDTQHASFARWADWRDTCRLCRQQACLLGRSDVTCRPVKIDAESSIH